MMKVLFWNVRWLGDRAKHRMAHDICRECNADIFCLEKTKLCAPHVRMLSDLVGNRHNEFIVKDSCEAMGGILIVFGLMSLSLQSHAPRTTRYQLSLHVGSTN